MMPHVLLIVVDALRADHLGCYAGSDRGTPNMDRLAREGVLFSNAISQSSWTRPAVASLMTGLYPSQHRLVDRPGNVRKGLASVAGLDHATTTLAELLAAAGYETAAFLGGNANLKPMFGLTRGFARSHWRPTTDGALLFEDFERWLREESPERSFSYLHFMDVHHPLPAEIIPSRLDRGLDLRAVRESMAELAAHYAESVRQVDGHVGRVLAALTSAGRLDDTWIVLTADHGEELMEHGAMLAHGRALYRELVRVPLVMRLPGEIPAGVVIDPPVQLIDLVPTMAERLGLAPPNVPGQSLGSLIRGVAAAAHPVAFSELLKGDRYIQSVTTPTHQLIVSYLFEEDGRGSPADLEPGLSVRVKGQPMRGGGFLATKVSIGPDKRTKLRGTVEHVDRGAGSMTAMGLTFRIDEETEFVGLDKAPFSPNELNVGDKVSATLDGDGAGGPLVASKVSRRKGGGKSSIGGRIERVQDLESGLRSITVLGLDVLVSHEAYVGMARERTRKAPRTDALSRVLAGDFLRREAELYDVADDPLQTRNIVDVRLDIAQELEAALAAWTQSLATGERSAGETVDLDPETLEQLRLMGYVD